MLGVSAKPVFIAGALLITIVIGGSRRAAADAGASPTPAAAWALSSQGETVLRPFAHAPYPHPSRSGGHAFGGKFFPQAGHYDDSTVGIFVPAGFRPRAQGVDFIVHFHGWSNHVSAVLDRYRLREQVEASGVNAILVVPQGPKDAQDSGDGKIELDPGAFAALLHEVAQFLYAEKKTRSAQIGRIVISAHSGGYKGASRSLQIGGLTDNVTDVLLFDAAYGDLDGFAQWQSAASGRRLVSLFTDDTASGNVQLMSLLQKSGTAFRVALDADIAQSALMPRTPFFAYTADLPHDQTMQGRGYFALFLATSDLPKR